MNIVRKDKKSFNLIKAKNKLKVWLKINYGLQQIEYQYINVKRKVFYRERFG